MFNSISDKFFHSTFSLVLQKKNTSVLPEISSLKDSPTRWRYFDQRADTQAIGYRSINISNDSLILILNLYQQFEHLN